MQSLRVLFLGAGKRLTLFERFRKAADMEEVDLELYSVESTLQVPIATIAKIITGPPFDSRQFPSDLMNIVSEQKIDIVIPCMDSATVALASSKEILKESGCWAVVSNTDLCRAMADKIQADKWFTEHGIATPQGDNYPLIAKHRRGFGSRDQATIHNDREMRAFFTTRQETDYIVQRFVSGQEYTVDAYVARDGRVLGLLSRKRLEVSAGEVETSETQHHDAILSAARRILSFGGWEGPITLQFIESGPAAVLIEINPRFGGGVTHSIHCGLDMPRWIIRERLNLPLEPVEAWPDSSVMTRCRRDIFFDHHD